MFKSLKGNKDARLALTGIGMVLVGSVATIVPRVLSGGQPPTAPAMVLSNLAPIVALIGTVLVPFGLVNIKKKAPGASRDVNLLLGIFVVAIIVIFLGFKLLTQILLSPR